jgi:hypothetical protein
VQAFQGALLRAANAATLNPIMVKLVFAKIAIVQWNL